MMNLTPPFIKFCPLNSVSHQYCCGFGRSRHSRPFGLLPQTKYINPTPGHEIIAIKQIRVQSQDETQGDLQGWRALGTISLS